MAGSRLMNTMAEGLVALGDVINKIKYAPDADIEFLTNLETQVLQYHQQKFAPQLPPSDPSMTGGPPPGMMMAGAPTAGGPDMAALLASMPPPMAGGPAGVSPAVPNPDELRRIQTVGPASPGR